MGGKKPRRSKKDQHREDLLDEALDQTFPASDPPAITMPHPPEDHGPDGQKSGKSQPKSP